MSIVYWKIVPNRAQILSESLELILNHICVEKLDFVFHLFFCYKTRSDIPLRLDRTSMLFFGFSLEVFQKLWYYVIVILCHAMA